MGNLASLPSIFICNHVTRFFDSNCCNKSGNYSSNENSNTIKFESKEKREDNIYEHELVK
jgi:hypothetical protein